MNLATLQSRLRQFADARNWHQYHTPKNLAMALVVEAAELVEVFQWMTPEESMALDAEAKDRAADEVADVLLYLLQIADKTGIDIESAVERKLAKNELKHPKA